MQRYNVLRKHGVPVNECRQVYQSTRRFIDKLVEYGGAPDQFPRLIVCDPPGGIRSNKPKAVARRTRRKHLRELGLDPDRAEWYADRPVQYAKLVKELSGG